MWAAYPGNLQVDCAELRRTFFGSLIALCLRPSIAKERAAVYFFNQGQDVQLHAFAYFEYALQLFHEWGAVGKVDHTVRKYNLEGSSFFSLKRSGAHLKRGTLDNSIKEQHRNKTLFVVTILRLLQHSKKVEVQFWKRRLPSVG
jgi:hypothetical protein